NPSDDNVSPQNFAGTFTFGGGSAPALDANNNSILDSTGQPVLAAITSIERYRRTLLFQSLGFSPSQIAVRGGGATPFRIVSGDPRLSASQFDIGLFVGDDWKPHPNLTLSLGFRYEAQTNIHDLHDFAPRIGIAWAVRPKTVVRVGSGIFYDRFSLANTMTALRQNGVRQQQYVIANPDFFPAIPPLASLATFTSTQTPHQLSPSLVAPRYYQSAFAVERQLPWSTTLAITYSNSHGLHMLRSRVNSLGAAGTVFVMESPGLYNQNQLIVNMNS